MCTQPEGVGSVGQVLYLLKTRVQFRRGYKFFFGPYVEEGFASWLEAMSRGDMTICVPSPRRFCSRLQNCTHVLGDKLRGTSTG